MSETEQGEHLDLVEDFFHNRARRWSEAYLRQDRVNDVILADRQAIGVEFVSERLPAGARILDVGCGAGHGSVELARRGYVVHGIDVAEGMIEVAEENLSAADIPASSWSLARCGLDGEHLEAGSFDGLIALGVIEYNDDEVAVLRRMLELLRPGGILVVTGPIRRRIANAFGLTEWIARKRAAGRGTDKGHRGVEAMYAVSVHGYSVARMRQMVESAGFVQEAWKGHGYAGFPLVPRLFGVRGEKGMNRMFEGLARVLPIQRAANDLVVVARRPADDAGSG